jgi:hypothetical protein
MAHEYLFDLSVTLASQQRHAEALKCLVAILANAPLPAMQARAGLLNARISLHSTCNLADVRALLNTLVRLPNKTGAFQHKETPHHGSKPHFGIDAHSTASNFISRIFNYF